MEYDKPFSVMRWINYKTADLKAFEKSAQYILNPKSAPEAYQRGYKISTSDPRRSMEIIEKRWKPRGDRNFKHGVFSFGMPDLDAKHALAVTDEIMKIYYPEYPILYAVHTNIPRRIHAHFVMGMTNVYTGKKFEQDMAEFNRFRDHYNKTLVRNGMMPLKGHHSTNQDCSDTKCAIKSHMDEFDSFDYRQDYSGFVPSVYRPIVAQQDFNLHRFFDQQMEHFMKFYNLGRGGF